MTDEVTGAIVVGVDGSVFSRAALRWAIAEGRQWSVPVVAVLAWHLDSLVCASLPITGVPVHPHETWEATFQRFLDGTVHRVCAETGGPRPITRPIAGLAADVLVEQSRDARLLALGSHGHGWLSGSVIGSVADHCLHHAACPVLVIPAGIVPAESEPPAVVVPSALLPDRYGLGPI